MHFLDLLGGLQGVIGWWMVTSGLSERTDVSHYRLAVHLLAALFILAGLVWTALDLKQLAAKETEILGEGLLAETTRVFRARVR